MIAPEQLRPAQAPRSSDWRAAQPRCGSALPLASRWLGLLEPLHGFGGNRAAFAGYRKMSTEAERQAIAVARAAVRTPTSRSLSISCSPLP
jgi:hypothetical protein